MENTKYGKRREGRWTPIRVKVQDTRANPNSWETRLVRNRWDIGLLRVLSPRTMMMMFIFTSYYSSTYCQDLSFLFIFSQVTNALYILISYHSSIYFHK